MEEDVPWLLLFLLTFNSQLCFSIFKTICICAGYLVMLSLLIFVGINFIHYPEFQLLYSHFRFLFSILHLAITACVCLLLSKSRRSVCVFFILVIKNYLDTIQLSSQLLGAASGLSCDLLETAHLILTAPLIYLFLNRLLRPIAQQTFSMDFWKNLWLVPLSFYFIFRLGIMPGYSEQLIPSAAATAVPPYIWFFITFVTYYLILYMLSETLKYTSLKEEMRITQIQSDIRSALYLQDIDRAEEIRKEILTPLTHLQQLAEAGDAEEIRSCIEGYLEQMTQTTGTPVCDNYTVDTILRHYLSQYKEQQLGTVLQANVTEDIFMSDIEITILLGNLLENALQACLRRTEGDAFIEIRLELSELKLLLSVKNSFSGTILENEDGFLSSRHSGNGLGTVSVRNIVEKHDGFVRFSYDKQIFTAEVMIYDMKREEKQ
ncbi:ATP-binding protein [Anaerovorax odorimutans]|uniref:ATP-binding protein n=2 Tax=Anaerovorax odorimutans TaxID=109327 RepID=A0ABT1RQC5_9FIRM|nr:ATP-binding protein [Anaerovorax odorimutans]